MPSRRMLDRVPPPPLEPRVDPELLDDEVLAKLTERQRTALPIVLASPSIRLGIEAAGIPRATWYRWMSGDRRFHAAWTALVRRRHAEALNELTGAARYAVTTLLSHLGHKDARIALLASRI